MDWQVFDVVMPMFGWMRGTDGRYGLDGRDGPGQGEGARAVRRFRRAAVWTPKKNGKSGLASGLGLYLLIGDAEEGAEVYCAASSRRQAGIIHKEAQKMVRRSAALKGRARVLESTNRILFPKTDSHFEAISSEAGVQEGLNWSGLMFDELHVADRNLVQTLEEGGIARAQSLMLAISTAGIYDPNAVGWDWWQLSQGVQRWSIQDWSFFSVMYAAPDTADPGAPETWRRANPSLGVILQEDQMAETWERAKHSSAQVASVRRYRLNQWVKSSHAWIEMKRWERLAGVLDEALLKGRPCWGGLDLSSTIDLSAFGLWFPGREEGEPSWWRCWFWLPEDNLEEIARAAQAPYRAWADEGKILLTDGDVIDHGAIRRKIVDVAGQYDLQQIAFDPWQATQIMTQLQEEDGIEMVRYPQQGPVLSPALKAMETEVRKGLLRHEGCPVMTWMMASAEVATDHNGNCRLVKGDRRARRKIDGVISMVMARDLAARALGEGCGKSKWEMEGAEVVVV
jgi:phage terminase large subunit-like protein